MTSQQDRANTNKNTLTILGATVRHTDPTTVFFCFHTTNNNGKKNIGAEGCTAVHAEDFRKLLSQLTHFKGYAIEHVTAIFGEAPKISGEIRFFEKFEQVWKINFYGVMKIMDEVVPDFLIHKWSEVTAKQIMLNYESGKNKGNLAIVIIEMCVVAVSLKLFCELCYRLERGELLVLRGGGIPSNWGIPPESHRSIVAVFGGLWLACIDTWVKSTYKNGIALSSGDVDTSITALDYNIKRLE